jgi:hypothetical protein
MRPSVLNAPATGRAPSNAPAAGVGTLGCVKQPQPRGRGSAVSARPPRERAPALISIERSVELPPSGPRGVARVTTPAGVHSAGALLKPPLMRQSLPGA